MEVMENKMRVLTFLLLLVLVNTIRTVEAEAGDGVVAEVDAEHTEEKRSTCNDIDSSCPGWASNGECENNPDWMLVNCRLSCKQCGEITTNITSRALPPTCSEGANVYMIGETYVKDCRTYKCISDGYKGWKIIIVSTLCIDYYGVCRYPGNIFTYFLNGRLRHSCHCTINADFSVSYQCGRPQIDSNCKDFDPKCSLKASSGECEKNPDWMSDNCRLSCNQCNSVICLVNGKAYPIGETYELNCNTYKCMSDGYRKWKTEIISTKCKDYNGVCRSPGETFPYLLEGRLRQNCQCTTKADFSSIFYQCKPIGQPTVIMGVYPTTRPATTPDRSTCLVDGKVFAEGEIFVKDCATYKCISRWKAKVVIAKCKDHDGFCRSPGDTFSYSSMGTLSHNCHCTTNDDGDIRIRCNLP